jgi:hypothetical protein
VLRVPHGRGSRHREGSHRSRGSGNLVVNNPCRRSTR